MSADAAPATPLPAAIAARLDAAGVTLAPAATARLMAGGYRNRVWRVAAADGTALVVKAFVQDEHPPNPLFPILADAEAAALRHLQGLGVAPAFVAFLPAGAVAGPALLVYRFVAGAPWQGDVTIAARLLARVHQLTPPGGLRPLPHTADALAAATAALLAPLPGDLSAGLRSRLARLPRAEPPPPAALGLIHTDCGPGNLIVCDPAAGPPEAPSPEAVLPEAVLPEAVLPEAVLPEAVLIDWQCPGLGCPSEDIACFRSPAMHILYGRAPLGPADARAFLAALPDRAAVARYHALAGHWHGRIAAYCLWRAHTLVTHAPDQAATYQRALAAELALMQDLVP